MKVLIFLPFQIQYQDQKTIINNMDDELSDIFEEFKIILFTEETFVYFTVQLITGATILFGVVLFLKLCHKIFEHKLESFIILVIMPLVDTWPIIFVWFEYNTNQKLATDSSRKEY